MGAEIAVVAGIGLWIGVFAVPRFARLLSGAAAVAWLVGACVGVAMGDAPVGVWLAALAAGAGAAAAALGSTSGTARGFSAAAAVAAAWALAEGAPGGEGAGWMRAGVSVAAVLALGAGVGAALSRAGYGAATTLGAAIAALASAFAWTPQGWVAPVALVTSDGSPVVALGIRASNGEIDGVARALMATAPGATAAALTLAAAVVAAAVALFLPRIATHRIRAGLAVAAGTALVAVASLAARRMAPGIDVDALVAASIPAGVGALERATVWPGPPAHAAITAAAALLAVGGFVAALGASRSGTPDARPDASMVGAGAAWAAATIALATLAALDATSTLPASGPPALAGALATAAFGFALLESASHGDLVRRVRYAVVGAAAVLLLSWTGGLP